MAKRAQHKQGDTELTGTAELKEWINEISKDHDLGLFAKIENVDSEGKRRDVTVYQQINRQRPFLTIEAKRPDFPVVLGDKRFENELKGDAFRKALRSGSRFFAVTNFRALLVFETAVVSHGIGTPWRTYSLADIQRIEDLEKPRHLQDAKAALEASLLDIVDKVGHPTVSHRQKPDEFLIISLKQAVDALTPDYTDAIEEQATKSRHFRKQITDHFRAQGWKSNGDHREDYRKLARQSATALLSKIFFYEALRAHHTHLDPLRIPDDITNPEAIRALFEAHFRRAVRDVNYEDIFKTDFVDSTAFPLHSDAFVGMLRQVVSLLSEEYDLKKADIDVIGKVFEAFIPDEERNIYGQHFTATLVSDLILSFVLLNPDDTLIDPSCGSGSILTRAYARKRYLEPRLTHIAILQSLLGVDISPFACHLARINLALFDLSKRLTPQIEDSDFFRFMPDAKLKSCAGNPPYTRQEAIEEITNDPHYKELLQEILSADGAKLANIDKKSGIYTYFFIHAWKMLEEGGRLGFVVSNAWLDTGYGGGLQEFLLNHFKIHAIVESRIERWFAEAEINTCIVILEKCSNELLRKNNVVRFVSLYKTLSELLIPNETEHKSGISIWHKTDLLRDAITNAITPKTISSHGSADADIFCMQQSDLILEGSPNGYYEGALWGKHLRTPSILRTLLNSGKFTALSQVAEYFRGTKTGADDWFYRDLDDQDRVPILSGNQPRFLEKQFYSTGKTLNRVAKGPKDVTNRTIEAEDLKQVLISSIAHKTHLRGTEMLKLIKIGETPVGDKPAISERPSVAGRSPWYSVPFVTAPIAVPIHFEANHGVYKVSKGVLLGSNFFGIGPKKLEHLYGIMGFLNSSLGCLCMEIIGRSSLGAGSIELVSEQFNKLPILSEKLLAKVKHSVVEKFMGSPVETIYAELGVTESGTELVDMATVAEHRRNLDQEIMGNILGLSIDQQKEVCDALVTLVRMRKAKSKSVPAKKKTAAEASLEHRLNRLMSFIPEKTMDILRQAYTACGGFGFISIPNNDGQSFRLERTLFGFECTRAKQSIFSSHDESLAGFVVALGACACPKIPIVTDQSSREALLEAVVALDKAIADELEAVTDPLVNTALRLSAWRRIWSV